MEIIYTKAYKVNYVISILLSVISAITAGYIGSLIFKDTVYTEINAVMAASVFILMHLFFTNKYRKRKKILSVPFPEEWRLILSGMVDFYNRLNDEERYIFEKKIQIFLSEKPVTGIGTSVDDRTRLLVASAAVIPVFRIEGWEYHRLSEVLVYPGRFDESFSFTGRHSNILGMVVQNTSSLIISRKDLYKGFSRKGGDNTAIHEFIHKIDEEDGEIDGLPVLLLDRETIMKWKTIREAEMELIMQGKSDINPYALTGEAEFLAVSGEYFFKQPGRMEEKHPELYRILKVIFRQDTASIIKSDALQLIRLTKSRAME
jgi:Mlc titration factor MtfA (ptsG expression regulator)